MSEPESSDQENILTGDVMDVDGVAAYLGFSSSTIYSKVKDLDIPYVRIGGSLRFSKVEIDKWLSRNTVRPQESFYAYFTQMADRFFFERWLETRGLDPATVSPEELTVTAKRSLDDLRAFKEESERFVD